MLISISNATPETWIVMAVLASLLLVSIQKRKDLEIFPVNTATELKGLAILFVIFSHIGYFLVNDHRFLIPFSNYGGVGVDLFLILSGYGLTASALKHPLSPLRFYKKRLFKIWLPVALALTLFLTIDFAFLHRSYPLALTIKNFFGFFPEADIYKNINSPLWFITPLIFYYLLFPLVFSRRTPLLSAGIVALVGWLLVRNNLSDYLSITPDLAKMYRLHFLAFPLGITLGVLFNQPPKLIQSIACRIRALISNYQFTTSSLFHLIIIAVTVTIFLYYHRYPAVGLEWKKEQLASLLLSLSLIGVFITKSFTAPLLQLCGRYSFEIYLLHWPLLYSYDFIYTHLPAGLATLLYLVFFLCLGYSCQYLIRLIPARVSRLKTATKQAPSMPR